MKIHLKVSSYIIIIIKQSKKFFFLISFEIFWFIEYE